VLLVRCISRVESWECSAVSGSSKKNQKIKKGICAEEIGQLM
jgi:hypothetical protein